MHDAALLPFPAAPARPDPSFHRRRLLLAYCSAPVHTATSIDIRAPREAVFALVRDLTRWPELLPHYRYVTKLGQNGPRDIVKMTCTRPGIPLAWTAAYESDPQTLELRF